MVSNYFSQYQSVYRYSLSIISLIFAEKNIVSRTFRSKSSTDGIARKAVVPYQETNFGLCNDVSLVV